MRIIEQLRKPVVGVIIPLFALMPVLPTVGLAQTTYPDACTQAQSDARANTSGMWFFAGCLGVTGILIAYIVDPAPPASAIIGKPPEWVAIYSDCYRSAGKNEQGKKALTGCCVMTAAYVAFYVVLVVVILANADESSDNWE